MVEEPFLGAVEAVEPFQGTDPKLTPPILQEGQDHAVGQRVGVFRIVLEDPEAIAVVAVQPVARAEPEEPMAILLDRVDRAVGKPVLDRQVLEAGRRRLCWERPGGDQAQQAAQAAGPQLAGAVDVERAQIRPRRIGAGMGGSNFLSGSLDQALGGVSRRRRWTTEVVRRAHRDGR